ncbi:MAG: type IV pilus assembly protein PilM [Planctomycetota bacterium]
MAKGNESWGIDVGSHAVKAVKLVRNGGEVRLEQFEVLPYPEVLTAPDVDAEEAIQLQLDALTQKHDFSNASVVASVPGNMAFARFAALPPVEPKKIPDIVKFEAQQQIPFPIEEVEWDYKVFQEEDSPDVKVGIFAITKERVLRFLSNYRTVDLELDELTLSPVAVFNAFAYEMASDDDDEGGTVLLDIGTVSTDVIVIEEGQIWLRTLPIGGNNFTEALVKQFKISYAKAEKLKKEAATSKYAKQIFQAMRSVFADLVQEVQRSIGYYQSMNRDSELKRVVGLGSTFQLPGLQKFLKQQLQMSVGKPAPFARVTLEGKRESELAGATGNLATAYGLALQGLGLEAVPANILPEHILRARLWKAKQPWILGAAAAVAVASGAYAAKYIVDRGSFESMKASVEPEIRQVTNNARTYEQAAQELMGGNPLQGIENYRLVLPQRDLYAYVMADIGAMLATVNPQEAIVNGDFEAIKAIPRSQRRMLSINMIADTYEPATEEVAADGGAQMDPFGGMGRGGMDMGMGMGMGMDMGMGMGGMGMGGGMSMGGGANGDIGALLTEGESKDFFSETSKPKLEIVMRGTTPLEAAAASALIRSTVLKWLADNAEREDVPYTIVLPDNPMPYLRPVGASGGARQNLGGMSMNRGGMGGMGMGGMGMGMGMGMDDGMGMGMGMGGMGMGGMSRSRMSGGLSGNVSVDQMLPQDPLLEEDRSTDNEFELRFSLELKDPNAAPEPEAPPTDPTAEPDQVRGDDSPADPTNSQELSTAPAALPIDPQSVPQAATNNSEVPA